jgi:hypothetical protein
LRQVTTQKAQRGSGSRFASSIFQRGTEAK